MVPWCESHVPMLAALPPAGMVDMVACKAPAVAAYRFRCIYGHQVTRSVCADHDPVPGTVGCYQCWQGGREEPMMWEVVEVGAGP